MRGRRGLPAVVLVLAVASLLPAAAVGGPGNGEIVFDSQAASSSLTGKIVYSSDWGDNVHNPELYAIRTDGSRRRNLTRHQGPEGGFAWAPTGGRIAFWAERFGVDGLVRGLYVMRADGSRQRRLTPSDILVDSRPLTWSPDGQRLAFAAHRGAIYGTWVVRADGRDLRLLAERATAAAWAPRGNRVALVAGDPAGRSTIRVVDADTGAGLRLTDGPSDFSPTWSPDARALAFVRVDLTADHESGLYRVAAGGGSPQQLVAGGGDFLREAAWSPRGGTIAFTRMTGVGRTTVETVRASGGRPRTFGLGAMAAWSPNGRSVAFASESAVHVATADGSGRRKLRDETPARITEGPAWSPDGKVLLFASMRYSADHELFVIAADGSRRRQLTRNAVEDVLPAWSPARNRIAFARYARRVPSVWVMDASGANQRRLSFGTHPSWSPDGSRLAFERDGSVLVMSNRGRNGRVVAEGGRPAWAPRGRGIGFVRGTELLVVDAQTRAVRALADLACEQGAETNVESPEWSPDGTRLVVPVACDFGKVGYVLAVLVDVGSGNATHLDIDLASSRPAWSPTGSRIAFTREDEYPRVATTLLDGTARTTVTSGAADDRDLDW